MAALGNYTVGNIIGRGEFATVKLGEHVGSCQKVAIKMLDRSRVDQKVQREIDNQRGLCHKHVINIEDVLETEDSMCLVLEYAPGGDIFDYIVRHVRLKEGEANRIFRQLVDGIAHCHAQGVVHRDLKPENILMDADNNVKIADFGLSSQWKKGELLTESCGSPNYAAPELLSKGCKYEGPEVDVWSCGVVLYTLLCGCLPFDDESIPALFKKIKQGQYTIPGYISPDAKDLIIKILTVDPASRISLQEIREHAWLKDEPAADAAAAPLPACNLDEDEAFAELPAGNGYAAAVKPVAAAEQGPAASTERRSVAFTANLQLPPSPMRTGSGHLLKKYSESLLQKSASCPYGTMQRSVLA